MLSSIFTAPRSPSIFKALALRVRQHGTYNIGGPTVNLTFVNKVKTTLETSGEDVKLHSKRVYFQDGTRSSVRAPLGASLVAVAHHNSIDMEAACAESLACATCHVIMEKRLMEKIPADR